MLVLILNSLLFTFSSGDELLLVQTVWRHGDRTPIKAYATDPNTEEVWTKLGQPGFGQLTANGMNQQFDFGEQIYQRYVSEMHFLSQTYSDDEVYIRSTDFYRTIMSAMSNTAGMYRNGRANIDYPGSNQNNSEWPSHWTPIPVHSVPTGDDHIGVMSSCARVDEIFEQNVKNGDRYKSIVAQYQDFIDMLSNKTGTKIESLFDINYISDAFFVESLYNLSRPIWLTDEIVDRSRLLHYYAFDFQAGLSVNGSEAMTEMIRLRGGNMLKAMIDRMKSKIECIARTSKCENWIKKLKYYAYSAHDTTVAALLATLGSKQQITRIPEYTAAVFVELWSVGNNSDYGVKIVYHPRHGYGFDSITNLTTGCPSNSDTCPFDDFVNRSLPYMPNDIDRECKKQSTTNRGRKTVGNAIAWIICLIASVAVLIGRTI